MATRLPWYRIHIWLSWIVGLQILLWVASGLFMALSPIETVRGEHLRRDPPRLDLRSAAGVRPPAEVLRAEKRPVERLVLKTWLGQPTYELHYAGGRAALVDARTLERVSPLTQSGAEMAARAAYRLDRPIAEIVRVDAGDVPLDFRRDEPAWRVRFATQSGAVFYVSAETGEVLAVRTTRWRLYDFMWGLHIMDWGGRENFNSPWLVAFSALSLLSVVAGAVLLFIRRRWGP
jgi:uncharacterized iron-regulated membrane protein